MFYACPHNRNCNRIKYDIHEQIQPCDAREKAEACIDSAVSTDSRNSENFNLAKLSMFMV